MRVFEDLEWKLDGNCVGEDTEKFYDPDVMPSECAECPVWTECLIYAKENKEQGWWGGSWFEYTDVEGPDWVEQLRSKK